MSILKIKDNRIKTAALGTSALYLVLTQVFFLPVEIPHKITACVSALFIASLWLCPWQMSLALLFSALGDHFGSCGNFLAQMGFFALGHIWFIVYFIDRYFKRVEPDRKLTGKAKGYLAMVIFCAIVLLCVVFFRVVPLVPASESVYTRYLYVLCLSALCFREAASLPWEPSFSYSQTSSLRGTNSLSLFHTATISCWYHISLPNGCSS